MISFDIFDTLITRRTYTPHGIFLLMQEKLCKTSFTNKYDFFCNSFCELRISAEIDARLYAEQNGLEEISLQDIYDLLKRRIQMSDEMITYIMDLEVQTEIENVYPIWTNINLLKTLVSEKKKVVLISDMYLTEDIIRRMLVKYDSVFNHIPIYISGVIKKTKQSGRLYLDVARKENIEFENWTHYGDNYKSDYLMPKMLGINANYIKPIELFTWEKYIGDKLSLQNNLALQFYFGTIRNIQLEKTINSFVGMGGMILYPYILWLISRSLEQKIDRLYFIARDGCVLKIIADQIIKNQQLEIQTSYIYGSREAWKIEKLIKTQKEILIKYLAQEIDFSDDNFAFVDSHGSGNTIANLSKIIEEEFDIKTKAFYFDLDADKQNESCLFMSFCSIHSGIVEYFCRAPHGVTTSYEQSDGKVVPFIQYADDKIWEMIGLYDYMNGIKVFADKMSENNLNYIFEDLTIVKSALNYCMNNPDQELFYFIDIISCYDDNQEENIKNTPILTMKDIFTLYMWRTVEDLSVFYKGSNLKFSLLKTGHKYDRFKYFLENNYCGFLGRVIHIIKNKKKSIKTQGEKKIIIYGAGEAGKRLYEHILTTSGFKVIAWTDMDFEKYNQNGFKLVPLAEALKCDYDFIIISINNLIVYSQVKNLFLELGIKKEKIIGYKNFLTVL